MLQTNTPRRSVRHESCLKCMPMRDRDTRCTSTVQASANSSRAQEIPRSLRDMHRLPVLVLNSGSSSIKFSIYEAGGGERARLFESAVDGIGTAQGNCGSRTPRAEGFGSVPRATQPIY